MPIDLQGVCDRAGIAARTLRSCAPLNAEGQSVAFTCVSVAPGGPQAWRAQALSGEVMLPVVLETEGVAGLDLLLQLH